MKIDIQTGQEITENLVDIEKIKKEFPGIPFQITNGKILDFDPKISLSEVQEKLTRCKQ